MSQVLRVGLGYHKASSAWFYSVNKSRKRVTLERKRSAKRCPNPELMMQNICMDRDTSKISIRRASIQFCLWFIAEAKKTECLHLPFHELKRSVYTLTRPDSHIILNMSDQPTISGSCLCQQIRYELTGDSQVKLLCHCNNCRKVSGSSFMANSVYQQDVSIIPSKICKPSILRTLHWLILSNSASSREKTF